MIFIIHCRFITWVWKLRQKEVGDNGTSPYYFREILCAMHSFACVTATSDKPACQVREVLGEWSQTLFYLSKNRRPELQTNRHYCTSNNYSERNIQYSYSFYISKKQNKKVCIVNHPGLYTYFILCQLLSYNFGTVLPSNCMSVFLIAW